MTVIKPKPFHPQNVPEAIQPWQVKDPAQIPRIRFVYGDTYAAGYLTVTFAAPKTGKSLLALAEAIDAASGRGILTKMEAAPMRVLYFNAEDDQDLLDARTVAALEENCIPQSEIEGRLFVVSGVAAERQLILIRGEQAELNEAAFTFLTETVKRENIALAIFDPLQDLSHSPETNEVFRALGARIRRMASETGVAIGLVHHTRKPGVGGQITLDDGRGGSALRGVARFNRLLAPMTEGEGAQAGVDDFRRFFRIAEAESNLAPPSSERNRWLEKVGVQIGNGGNYPTVRPWSWPEAFTGVTVNDTCRVRAAIADRAANDNPPRADAQANDWAGHLVASVLGLDMGKASEKARVKTMLRKWVETGVLRVERMPFGPKNKEANFVFVGPNNPGSES